MSSLSSNVSDELSFERPLAIAKFSIQGKECVIVGPEASECEELEVIGEVQINGQTFCVACHSAVQAMDDPLAILSPRELEIARCIAAGYQTKSIARRLDISYYTVRVHLGRIYCKLGLHKQTELASWISARYVKPPDVARSVEPATSKGSPGCE